MATKSTTTKPNKSITNPPATKKEKILTNRPKGKVKPKKVEYETTSHSLGEDGEVQLVVRTKKTPGEENSGNPKFHDSEFILFPEEESIDGGEIVFAEGEIIHDDEGFPMIFFNYLMVDWSTLDMMSTVNGLLLALCDPEIDKEGNFTGNIPPLTSQDNSSSPIPTSELN